MTMHLHHPSLSLSGKKKGKVKFRNADEARKARELDASWKQLKSKWQVEEEEKKRSRALKASALVYSLSTPVGRTTQRINSLDTGHVGAVATKQIPQYTGTKIIGISQMAKSNAVPVFEQEHIIDIARMRR
jgi:hypothetical protein